MIYDTCVGDLNNDFDSSDITHCESVAAISCNVGGGGECRGNEGDEDVPSVWH